MGVFVKRVTLKLLHENIYLLGSQPQIFSRVFLTVFKYCNLRRKQSNPLGLHGLRISARYLISNPVESQGYISSLLIGQNRCLTKHKAETSQSQRPRSRGAGGTCPPIFLELQRVSKKKCLVPLQYRVTNGVPPPPPQSQSCSAVPESEATIYIHATKRKLKQDIVH